MTDPRWMKLTCRACHDWTHRNVAEAEERGFLVRSWQGEAEAS